MPLSTRELTRAHAALHIVQRQRRGELDASGRTSRKLLEWALSSLLRIDAEVRTALAERDGDRGSLARLGARMILVQDALNGVRMTRSK